MWHEPLVTEAGMMLQQPKHTVCSPGAVVPTSQDPGSGRLPRLLGMGGVDSDLCLHTGFLVAAEAALLFHARLWFPS